MKPSLAYPIRLPVADLPAEVCGPYSPWPRRFPKRPIVGVGIAVASIAAGVFIHCAVPLIA